MWQRESSWDEFTMTGCRDLSQLYFHGRVFHLKMAAASLMREIFKEAVCSFWKRQVFNTVNQKKNFLGTLEKNEEISEFIVKKFLFEILS